MPRRARLTSPDRGVVAAATQACRELEGLASPPGAFDPSRYFRSDQPLPFLNVRAPVVRALARRVATEHREDWAIDEALGFADALVHDARFEVKGLGIELLARFGRQVAPAHLRVFKRWLAGGHASNWATTDSICGYLITPLLTRHPDLVPEVASWAGHGNLWVRRAAAVSLVKTASRGLSLDTAYAVVTTLQADPHDLIHKAVGWLLREAGKTDRPRLERYLLAQGARVPRTTLRYAIEHFPASDRQRLLAATRAEPRGRVVKGRPATRTTKR